MKMSAFARTRCRRLWWGLQWATCAARIWPPQPVSPSPDFQFYIAGLQIARSLWWQLCRGTWRPVGGSTWATRVTKSIKKFKILYSSVQCEWTENIETRFYRNWLVWGIFSMPSSALSRVSYNKCAGGVVSLRLRKALANTRTTWAIGLRL